MFGAYFVIAVVIGHLVTQLHEREQAERRREERPPTVSSHADAGRQPQSRSTLANFLQLIRDFFKADAAVWLRDEKWPDATSHQRLSASKKDERVAMWAFQKKQAAGKSTDTLPDSECLHVPL